MRLKIHEADLKDVPEIFLRIKEYALDVEEDILLGVENTQSKIVDFIEDDTKCVYKAVLDNEIVGLVMAMKIETPVNKTYAVEIVLHANLDLGKIKRYKILYELMDTLEHWAAVKKVNYLLVNVKPNNSVGKFLTQRDFKVSEINYRKEVC